MLRAAVLREGAALAENLVTEMLDEGFFELDALQLACRGEDFSVRGGWSGCGQKQTREDSGERRFA